MKSILIKDICLPAVVAAACCVLQSGCELADKLADTTASTNATTSATSTNSSSTSTNTATNITVGARVTGGSSADSNSETDNLGNSSIWINGAVSLGVRCLANDDTGSGYYCDDVVSDEGGLTMYVNTNGTITATGSDFISSNSGLVYKFLGFRIATYAASLTTTNPRILEKSEQTGTFRAYWDTYQQP